MNTEQGILNVEVLKIVFLIISLTLSSKTPIFVLKILYDN